MHADARPIDRYATLIKREPIPSIPTHTCYTGIDNPLPESTE